MNEKHEILAANVLNSAFETVKPSGDGVALRAVQHPCAEPAAALPIDLDPSSLQTIEIDVPERSPPGRPTYDPLPISRDLCAQALEWAVKLLDPQVSCDLWVSKPLYQDNVGQVLLRYNFPPDFIVNRVRMLESLNPFEWFVECGDGRCVGSDPPL